MSRCDAVWRELERYGLLLLQDKKLPSVVGIIAGEPVKGSWWSHPRAQEIFDCAARLEDESLPTKLIGGKVTFVHPRLWPAIAAVGASNEKWQTSNLPREKRAREKETEKRLLVVAREIHTESGKHETQVERWEDWMRRNRVKPISADDGKRALEEAAAALGAKMSSLPWR